MRKCDEELAKSTFELYFNKNVYYKQCITVKETFESVVSVECDTSDHLVYRNKVSIFILKFVEKVNKIFKGLLELLLSCLAAVDTYFQISQNIWTWNFSLKK